MTAYNKYNGIPCSTDNFIKEILIDEWGMDGQILSDGREAVDRRSLELDSEDLIKVEIVVDETDMKLWDIDKHAFTFDKGEYEFMVGASSADIRLRKSMKM